MIRRGSLFLTLGFYGLLCDIYNQEKLKRIQTGLMPDLATEKVRVTPLLKNSGETEP